jgi:hypothetical protein
MEQQDRVAAVATLLDPGRMPIDVDSLAHEAPSDSAETLQGGR